MKWAENCESSVLLTISTCPSFSNFSTHGEATVPDVMAFKFPSMPRSCQHKAVNKVISKRNKKQWELEAFKKRKKIGKTKTK